MNGYNFTERVRRVLASAREEAATLNHEYVGTEHILLGLVREQSGVAITVIENLGAVPEGLRHKITEVIQRGRPMPVHGRDLPYTSRAKKVLELSMSEARDLGHEYVGTEHALLGLIREEKGVAAQVLMDAGITLDAARAEVRRLLGEPGHAKPSLPPPKSRSAEAYFPKSAQRVREIIAAAHDVAATRQSRIVLPAHVTIALLEHAPRGMANAALDRLRFDRAAALSALHDIAPVGPDAVSADDVIMMAPALVTVVEAMEAFRRDMDARTDAGSQHLLLALVFTCVEIDAVFAAQNISANDIREEILRISG